MISCYLVLNFKKKKQINTEMKNKSIKRLLCNLTLLFSRYIVIVKQKLLKIVQSIFDRGKNSKVKSYKNGRRLW